MQNDKAISSSWVIVGLGNPGKQYELTRHNMGALVVQGYANRCGWTFKEESKLLAKTCRGKRGEFEIHLVLPTTYMNLSGNAVRRYLEYYKVAPDQLMVVVDDVELPFGALRLRSFGGTGGHNGLKSVRDELKTERYWRLRVGIGRQQEGIDMADYVLDRFSEEEMGKLSQVVVSSEEAIDAFLLKGPEAAIKQANTKGET